MNVVEDKKNMLNAGQRQTQKKRETKMGGNLLSYSRETCLVLKWSDRVDMTGGGRGGGVTGTTESSR